MDDYDEESTEIKFNADDQLPLNKTIEIKSLIIVLRVVFHENYKYYPDRIDAFEGNDVNKTSKSKEYGICQYWYLLSKEFHFQPDVYNRCRDELMMSMDVSNIAILNKKC